MLRFPNPSSDIPRLVSSYRLIHTKTPDGASLDHHFMTKVMIEDGQASSRGAVGVEALRRSTEKDLTRDPLYNQLKMYSELYRMFGWLRPTHMRSDFKHTPLGDEVLTGKACPRSLKGYDFL